MIQNDFEKVKAAYLGKLKISRDAFLSGINAYLDEHDLSMDEFIAMAAQDELHPKTPEVEVKEVGNTRTLAFQVPEELFQRIKDYLKRNGMTQKAFVIGLIEDELDRDEELLRKQQEGTEQTEEEEQGEGLSGAGEAPVSENGPEVEYGDEPEESPAVADFEGEQKAPEEEQDEGISEDDEAPVSEDRPEVEYSDEPEESPDVGDSEGSFEPEDKEDPDEGYEELEDSEFPEETVQDTPGPEYVEGELGAAVEVAPNFDYGQDDPSNFPEPDGEEGAEDFGMNMGM